MLTDVFGPRYDFIITATANCHLTMKTTPLPIASDRFLFYPAVSLPS